MTHDQIEAYRVKKTKILVEDPNVHDSLVDLAEKVGASTTNRDKGHGKATIPQLAENIDSALQTASMIDVCKTAARNFWITMVAAIAAVVSALAALAAVLAS